jgi:hypothetical protein
VKLGNCSISYLLDQFKAQQEYHSQPVSCQSQTKGAHAIEQTISLTATLEAQKENLKDAIAEGINFVEGESASNLVQAEWQEKVQLLREAIQHLEGTIKKKTDELRCKLEKAKAISATVHELSREQRRGATESIRRFRSVLTKVFC